MAEENKFQMENDTDLDSLLDETLADFNKPMPSAEVTVQPAGGGVVPPTDGLLTEDVIQQATQNFEASMRAIMQQQQRVLAEAAAQQQNVPGVNASGSLPPDVAQFDVNKLTSEFAKFAEAASKATDSPLAGGPNTNPLRGAGVPAAQSSEQPDIHKLLTETMQQMAQNNEQLQSAPSAEEMTKLLEGLGLGGGPGQDGGEGGGVFPLMQSMLENILAKEVLYAPIKEIVDKYPDWLADNRATAEPAEFDRFCRQFDIMKQVVNLFDAEKEGDSADVKAKRFEDLVMLMQKLQEEGHPPAALAGDVSGNVNDLINMDLSRAGAAGGMPDFASLLSNLGNMTAQADAAPGGAAATGAAEQCCVM